MNTQQVNKCSSEAVGNVRILLHGSQKTSRIGVGVYATIQNDSK